MLLSSLLNLPYYIVLDFRLIQRCKNIKFLYTVQFFTKKLSTKLSTAIDDLLLNNIIKKSEMCKHFLINFGFGVQRLYYPVCVFTNLREIEYVFVFQSEPLVQLLLGFKPAVEHLFELVRVFRVVIVHYEQLGGASRLNLLQPFLHAVLCATNLICVGREVAYQIYISSHIMRVSKTCCRPSPFSFPLVS